MSNPLGRLNDDFPASEPTISKVVADATCTGCGCLCDDIHLGVEDGRIVAALHACDMGRRWFLADHDQRSFPTAMIDGRPAGKDEAIDHAAGVLRKAQAPV